MTALLVDLAPLSLSELDTVTRQAGLGSSRITDPFVRRVMAAILAAVDDEQLRRLAQRAPFPHSIELPLAEDADPFQADLDLNALLTVVLMLRERSAASAGRLGALWGELTAQLAALRDERSRQLGEVGRLLGNRPVV